MEVDLAFVRGSELTWSFVWGSKMTWFQCKDQHGLGFSEVVEVNLVLV